MCVAPPFILCFISLSANFYRQKSKQIMLKVKTSQQLIEIISWLIYSKVKTDLLVIGPSGWDHRWRLHGSVWAAGAERQTPRQRDRRDVAGPVRAGQNVQDPTQTQRPAETQDRHTHRWVLTHKVVASGKCKTCRVPVFLFTSPQKHILIQF